MGTLKLAEILDLSIEVLKKYIKTIIIHVFGYGVIAFFIMLISGILAAIIIGTTLLSDKYLPYISLTFFVVFYVSLILCLDIGIIKITAQEFFEERVLPGNAISSSLKSIPTVFGIIFSSAILFLPAGILFGYTGYYLFKNLGVTLSLYESLIGKELGFIILVLLIVLAALFIFAVYAAFLCFSLHAAAIEKKGVIGSIKRSYELVKESFWRIFGYIIIIYLIINFLHLSFQALISLIASIVYLIARMLSIRAELLNFVTMAISLSNLPLNLLSWLVINPIGVIMLSILYFNQRFEREGLDMVLRLGYIKKNNERNRLSDDTELGNSIKG